MDDLSKIKDLLKNDDRGLNIREISEKLKINRNSVAKLLDILTIKEEVEIRVYGRSKVYYLAQKIPLSDFMKFSSNFIIALNRDLRIVQVNIAFLHYIKIPKNKVLHARLTDIPTNLFKDPKIVPAAESAISGKEKHLEICVKKTKTRDSYYKITFTPTRFQDLSCGVILFLENITEKKKIENALRKSEHKYRILVENIPERIFLKDASFAYISCNEHYARDLGIAADTIAGKTDFDFYPHDLVEKYRADDLAVMQSGVTSLIEEQYIIHGTESWVSTLKTPIKDDAGNVSGILGIFHDITEHKKAAIALEQSKNQLAEIINFLPDATFVIDKTGGVIAWNRAIEEMTGLSSKDILGKGDYEYSLPFYGERRPIFIDLVLNDCEEIRNRYPFVIKKGDRFISEIFIRHLNGGKDAYLWLIASPLYDIHGNITGAIESMRDITEKKQVVGTLIQRNEELQAAYKQIKKTETELWIKKKSVR